MPDYPVIENITKIQEYQLFSWEVATHQELQLNVENSFLDGYFTFKLTLFNCTGVVNPKAK